MVDATLFGPEIAVIVILAGVAALAGRVLGMSPSPMFLGAGILVGPVLGLVDGGSGAEMLADLGMVFLLFLIGLELKFDRIKPVLRSTLTVTPVQMLITSLVFFGIAMLYFDRTTAIIIGVATAYSSTAVVLHMLTERNEIGTEAGRLDMGLLLFEDITVIVVIAAITAGGAASALSGAVIQALTALAVIGGAAYISARFLLPHVLSRFYDRPHAYFMQALGGLFLFIGISELLGISHELGAFFAGIAIAQLPVNEEIHEQMRPLTELFMALFFISLSLQITSEHLLMHLDIALLMAMVVFIDKFVVHLGLFKLAGYGRETSFRGAVNMMQTSDFSIIVGATALDAGLIGGDILGLLTLVALVTMMISTILIDQQDWLYSLIGDPEHGEHSEADVVLAGYGEIGPDILQILERYFADITVVDTSITTEQKLAATPHEHVYADIRHETVKREAGFYTASLIVAITPEPEEGLDLLEVRPDETPVIMIAEDTETAALFRESGAALVLTRDELGAEHLQRVIANTLEADTDG